MPAAPSWQAQLTTFSVRPSSIAASIASSPVGLHRHVVPLGRPVAQREGDQLAEPRRPGPSGPAASPDLEPQPPLGPQGAVRLEEAVGGVVDAGGLRRHPVELAHPEAAGLERPPPLRAPARRAAPAPAAPTPSPRSPASCVRTGPHPRPGLIRKNWTRATGSAGGSPAG